MKPVLVAAAAAALLGAGAVEQAGATDREVRREHRREQHRERHRDRDRHAVQQHSAPRPGEPDPYAPKVGAPNPYATQGGTPNPYATRGGDPPAALPQRTDKGMQRR